MTRTTAANLAGALLLLVAVLLGGWAAWSLSPYFLALILAGALGAAGRHLALIAPPDTEES